MAWYRIFFLLLFFSGCHLGPRYESPTVDVPCAWKGPSSIQELGEGENWWELFEDLELARLEQEVIEKNPDLYIALQRVAEARAVAGIAKSDLYPELTLNPVYDNLGALIELYGVPQGLIPGLKTITRVHEQTYQLPIAMSYEVDLWGKYRGTYNAARIYAEAQDEALKATILTLTSDLASNYFNLRAMDTQIGLLSSLLEIRKSLLELHYLQFEAGLIGYTEVLQAEHQFSNLEAEYQDSLRQRELFENAIAVLIGTPAPELQIKAFPLRISPPLIPAGMPSDVLLRRPDVSQAERTMAAFHEFIGVAYSTYFPAFTLTGALGASSPDLSHFLQWASRLWQIGVNVAQILFNGGRNSAEVDLAFAKFRETEGAYKQAVLIAFQEVEDALNNTDSQMKQIASLKRAFMAAKEAYALSNLRFQKGVANVLETLVREEAKIQAKRLWMGTLGQQYQSTIQLIKALGGGWQPCSVASEEPSAEKSSCSSQNDERHEGKRPNMVQDSGCRDGFQEDASRDIEEIAQGVEISHRL